MPPPLPNLQILCPNCGARIRLKDPAQLGKKIRCPKCAEIFRTPQPPPMEDDDLEEDTPDQSDDLPDEDDFISPSRVPSRKSRSPSSKKSPRKRKSKSSSFRFQPWMLALPAVLFIGLGLFIFPPSRILQTINHVNPFVDSLAKVRNDLMSLRENYADLLLQVNDQTSEEELEKSMRNICARAQDLQKRALLLTCDTPADTNADNKRIEEFMNRAQKIRDKMATLKGKPHPKLVSVFRKFEIRTPDSYFSMAAGAIMHVPKEPEIGSTPQQRARYDQFYIRDNVLKTLVHLTSEDQIPAAVTHVAQQREKLQNLLRQFRPDFTVPLDDWFSLNQIRNHARFDALNQFLKSEITHNHEYRTALAQFELVSKHLDDEIAKSGNGTPRSAKVSPKKQDPHPKFLPNDLLPNFTPDPTSPKTLPTNSPPPNSPDAKHNPGTTTPDPENPFKLEK